MLGLFAFATTQQLHAHQVVLGILLAAFGTAVTPLILKWIDFGPRRLGLHSPSSAKKWPLFLWIGVAIIILFAPIYFLRWEFITPLPPMGAGPEDISKFLGMPVLTVWISSIPFRLSLITLGILIGIACALFTGLSVGEVQGGWSGVAAGLWGGFVTAPVGIFAFDNTHHIKAYHVVQGILIAAFGTAVTPFIVKNVSLYKGKLDAWQLKAFNWMRKYRASNTCLTSVLSMLIVVVYVYSFHKEVYLDFLTAVASISIVYLVLNLVADSFSIIETHIIFSKLRDRKTLRGVFLWVLADLALSAVIYLALPIATWSLDIFPAVRFRGPKPWLGILFWSTFSTSFMLYGFTIFALLFKFLKPLQVIFNLFSSIWKSPTVAFFFTASTLVLFILTSVYVLSNVVALSLQMIFFARQGL